MLLVLEVLESDGADADLSDGVEEHMEEFHKEFRMFSEEMQFVG